MDDKTKNILDEFIKHADEMALLIIDHSFTYASLDEKCFHDSLAEAYKDLCSFALLMENTCWTQAGVILRLAIERICSLYDILKYDGCYQKYIEINKEKALYYSSSNDIKKAFRKSKNYKKEGELNLYFDFGWGEEYFAKGVSPRNEVLRLAGLDEVIKDINGFLNKFAHGSISILQFSGGEEPWEFMKIQGERMIRISIALFQRLYWITIDYLKLRPTSLPIYKAYKLSENILEVKR